MAPPTPVLTVNEVAKIKTKLEEKYKGDCQLKSITQFQCQFIGSEGTGYICRPFKRIFEECGDSRVEDTNKYTNAQIASPITQE